ncbi:hypothetical protein L3X38_027693 [Prunus dulcis]|uniref:Uncharacterized protein n=1 Tax=Prunus dulcis TaxID=3755 RepID=A0AAD4Z0H9_PRUDU|nr:hypothetical protein L3X38_027693 [Prunus dulcis]
MFLLLVQCGNIFKALQEKRHTFTLHIRHDIPSPSTSDIPEILQILPPSSSPKEYLYVQYGGQSYGNDVDFHSVETVFKKLHAI